MKQRLHAEDGFTLPELLITLIMALIISFATFSLVEIIMKRSGDVASRVDTTQRARATMDVITRQLRSQVCAWRSDVSTSAARSIDDATPTSVSIYTDFSDEALVSGVRPSPSLHTLSFASSTLTETVTKATPTADSHVSYEDPSGARTSTRTLLTGVDPLDPEATPLVYFRYYGFNTANPPQPVAEIAPGRKLTPTELGQVAKISIAYRVLSKTGGKSGSTELRNEVFVRTADPNTSTPRPTCLTL